MKAFFIIIILPFLYKASTQGIDFQNGVTKTFNNFYSHINYYLHIGIKQFQTAFFSMSFSSNNDNAIYKIIVYGQKIKSESYLSYTEKYEFEINNNIKNITLFCTAKSSDTYNFAFRLALNKNINDIKIKIDIEGGAFDLSNGVTKTFNKFLPNVYYYFFISGKKFQELYFSLNANIIKKNYDESFFYLEFYEDNSKTLSSSDKYDNNYTKIIEDNKLSVSSLYSTHSTKKFVSFVIHQSYYLEYISIRIDIKKDYEILENGLSIIKNLFSNCTYFYFIKTQKYQQVKIELNMNSGSNKPVNDFYVNEHSTIDPNSVLSSVKYPFNSSNNELFAKNSFIATQNFQSYYVSIKIIPISFISSINITLDINFITYYLNDGISQNIINFIKEVPYYFYINVSQFQKVNITLITDFNSKLPFKDLNFYVHSKINSYYLEILPLSSETKKDNKLELFYSLIVSYYSPDYIHFKIIPTINISYIIAKADIGGGTFDLNNGIEKRFEKLKKWNEYFFFVNINQFQKANISLTMNYVDNQPLSDFSIYEFKSKYPYDYKKFKYDYKNIISNNLSLIYSSYTLTSNYIKNISFTFMPKYDIDYINVRIDIENAFYNLVSGKSQIIKNIISENSYILFIDAYTFQSAYFNLAFNCTNNTNNNIFEILNIYECLDKSEFPESYTPISQYDIIEKNNLSVLSFLHVVKKSSINFLALKFKSKYNLEFINAKIDIVGEFFHLQIGDYDNIFYNLKKGKVYYFCFGNYHYEDIIFKLYFNNEQEKILNNIEICEYNDKMTDLSNKCISKNIQFIKVEGNTTNIIGLISFTTTKTNAYIRFKVIPDFDIKILNIKSIGEKKAESYHIYISCILISLPIIIVIILTIYIKKIKITSTSKKSQKKENYPLGPLEPKNDDNNSNINDNLIN